MCVCMCEAYGEKVISRQAVEKFVYFKNGRNDVTVEYPKREDRRRQQPANKQLKKLPRRCPFLMAALNENDVAKERYRSDEEVKNATSDYCKLTDTKKRKFW